MCIFVLLWTFSIGPISDVNTGGGTTCDQYQGHSEADPTAPPKRAEREGVAVASARVTSVGQSTGALFNKAHFQTDKNGRIVGYANVNLIPENTQ